MTRFVGRQTDRAALLDVLEAADAVSVVGPPGIGKSALARSLAPARWVDLDGASTEAELRARCLAAVGAPEPGAAPGGGLWVFDAVDDAPEARLWAWIDAATRDGRVVLTARRRRELGVPVHELGPLGVEDGVSLLRGALDPRRSAALTDAALAEVVAAVDGVPMALALAAPRLRVRSPREVARQGPEAEGPLADAIRGALAALDPASRGVLGLAAGWPGPFDAAAMAAAWGGPVDAPLLALLDASLLSSLDEDPPRFRVLSPVRAAVGGALGGEALDRLGPHVLAPVEAALHGLETISSPTSAAAIAEATPVLEALLRATSPAVRLRAAIALSSFERRHGSGADTVARGTVVPDEGPAPLRVRWAVEVATHALALGQVSVARAALERVEGALEPHTTPLWRSARAMWASTEGRHEAAIAEAEAAHAASPTPELTFRVGLAHFAASDPQSAAAWWARAAESPSAFRRAQATIARATALRDLGEPPEQVRSALSIGAPEDVVAAFPWLWPRFAVLHGVLLADAGATEAAEGWLRRAAAALGRLGEAGDAATVGRTADVVAWLAGAHPAAWLSPDPPGLALHHAAPLAVWRAVGHALLGHRSAAEALGPPALDALAAIAHPQHLELEATWAVALAPSAPALSAARLAPLLDHPLVAAARAVLAGKPLDPRVPRHEHRVLVALQARQRGAVRVATDGSAFVGDDHRRVDIAGRKVLRRVLEALAAAEGPIGVDAICAAVWPGERLVGDSGTRRVHVAISTLRGLGLRGAIQTVTDATGTAWRLDAARSAPEALAAWAGASG